MQCFTLKGAVGLTSRQRYNQKVMELSEAVRKIETIFQSRPPKKLKTISVIGCCSYHAADFEWYRDHEWKDVRNEISENVGDRSKGLDPFQFGSLHRVAFHYFLPGVLTGIGDIIKHQQPSPDLDFCMDWFTGVSPLKQDQGWERFRREQLRLFTEEERSAVKNFWETFASYLQDSPKDKEEVEEIVREVWS